jgi:hypothetical protein
LSFARSFHLKSKHKYCHIYQVHFLVYYSLLSSLVFFSHFFVLNVL